MSPFPFRHISELLERIEALERRQRSSCPRLRKDHDAAVRKIVDCWSRTHRAALHTPDTDLVAVLSTLFPERRTDRVYALQHTALSKTLARALRLSAAKTKRLTQYRTPGNGDLALCLCHILKETDADPRPTVGGKASPLTVAEVDQTLHALASRCQFSSPEVRRTRSPDDAATLLERVFLRAYALDAKWLVRIILKDLSPVCLEEEYVLGGIHFLLPSLLKFQNNFGAVTSLLKGPMKTIPPRPDPSMVTTFMKMAGELIKPQVGIKIGVAGFRKAWSFKNCMEMVGNTRWSVEQKYDGEYCEIHVDLTKQPSHHIKIFSKSGKDSTEDRKGLHDTIQKTLRIGMPDCQFRSKCILTGEMVVFSDKKNQVLGFHKIRKHVSRSGRFLGTAMDSQKHSDEHLMIIYYDVLLIDNEIVMNLPYHQRRDRLRTLIQPIPGRARAAERSVMDFSNRESKSFLLEHFAFALYRRNEGLVLKPENAPYFLPYKIAECYQPCHFIKLKKDYMAEFGSRRDVVDMAIVGASYDAQLAMKSRTPSLKYTTFHIGCLINKADVLRFDTQPKFRIVTTIDLNSCISEKDLRILNRDGSFRAQPFCQHKQHEDMELDFGPAECRMTTLFKEPFVAEILGGGYEKLPNNDIFMLRHPRILKLHFDRSWKETVSLNELACLAEEARNIPESSQEDTDKVIGKVNSLIESLRWRDSQRTTSRQSSVVDAPQQMDPHSKKSSPRKRGQPKHLQPSPLKICTDSSETSILLLESPVEVPASPCPSRVLRPRQNPPQLPTPSSSAEATEHFTKTPNTSKPPPSTYTAQSNYSQQKLIGSSNNGETLESGKQPSLSSASLPHSAVKPPRASKRALPRSEKENCLPCGKRPCLNDKRPASLKSTKKGQGQHDPEDDVSHQVASKQLRLEATLAYPANIQSRILEFGAKTMEELDTIGESVLAIKEQLAEILGLLRRSNDTAS